MAFPPSNTERWYLSYSVGSIQHTMMMRTTDGRTAADVSDAFDAFLTELAPVISEIAILGLEVAEINSNVRNPQTWGGAPNYGTGTPPVGYSPVELTFTGRTSLGHKTRVSFFGYDGAFVSSFRFVVGDVDELDAARGTLDDFSGRWLGIDGNSPIWHPYTNIGSNDHWVKKAREAGA